MPGTSVPVGDSPIPCSFRPEGGRSKSHASAYTQNFYHTVFGTKQRANLIHPEREQRLYHLLVRYRADLSHSEMLQQIKGRSAKWVNETLPQQRHFAWQEGYGGFTVGKSVVPEVEQYIARQKEHHKRQDFKTEFLELLRRHGIEFDENQVSQ